MIGEGFLANEIVSLHQGSLRLTFEPPKFHC